MATGNFHYHTNLCYALPDDGPNVLEDALDRIKVEAARMGLTLEKYLAPEKFDTKSYGRHYYTHLAEYSVEQPYYGGFITVSAGIGVRAGYYTGGCYDCCIIAEFYGSKIADSHYDDSYTDVDEIEELLLECSDVPKGFIQHAAIKVRDKADELIDEVEDTTNRLLAAAAEVKLACLGSASNGETFYRKVD